MDSWQWGSLTSLAKSKFTVFLSICINAALRISPPHQGLFLNKYIVSLLISLYVCMCVSRFSLRSTREGHNTLDVVFRKLAWSFNAIDEGKWPKWNWDGTKIFSEQALPSPHMSYSIYGFG